MRDTPDMPIWNAIQSHLAKPGYPFHVPGHKGGRGLPTRFLELLPQADLTELPGLDNLYSPEGAIAQAENLAAELFGVAATLFTTNGSSAGLIASVLANCPSGGTVVLPRHCHISLLHACVLGDLSPVFVETMVDLYNGVPLGATADQIDSVLTQTQAGAVVIVNPTYHGVGCDVLGVSDLCRARGVPLIVDEAHGTHLFFNPTAPTSALRSTADCVVQSVHKTGLALTGAAWVHVRNKHLVPRVRAAMRLVQSTSPSYLLLASLDMARATMAEQGNELFARARDVAASVAELLPIYVPPLPWSSDPLRIVVDALALNMSGFALGARLTEQGIVPEMTDSSTATLVLSLADGPEAAEKLRSARGISQQLTKGARHCFRALPPMGRQVVRPRQAYFAEKSSCPIHMAVGRVAAEAVTPYPPGIPVLWPGQEITADIVAFVQDLRRQVTSITGLSPRGDVLVVTEV